jgi:hypothetical protein
MYLLRNKQIIKAIFSVLILTMLPFSLSIPWKILGSSQNWQADQVAFGLLNQAVFRPGSPYLGEASPLYAEALKNSMINGELPNSGISDNLIYAMLPGISKEIGANPNRYFLSVIYENPLRYLQGFIRGFLMLMNIGGTESDNLPFLEILSKASEHTTISAPTYLIPWITDIFKGDYGSQSLEEYLLFSAKPFLILYTVGCIGLTLLLSLQLFYNIDMKACQIAILCLGYLAFHAAVLFSLDRMAVPIMPVVCGLTIAFTVRFGHAISRMGSKVLLKKNDRPANKSPNGVIVHFS